MKTRCIWNQQSLNSFNLTFMNSSPQLWYKLNLNRLTKVLGNDIPTTFICLMMIWHISLAAAICDFSPRRPPMADRIIKGCYDFTYPLHSSVWWWSDISPWQPRSVPSPPVGPQWPIVWWTAHISWRTRRPRGWAWPLGWPPAPVRGWGIRRCYAPAIDLPSASQTLCTPVNGMMVK